MQLGRIGAVVGLSLILAQMACGSSRETARVKLAQMNIKYSDETFVDRAKDGDLIVVGHFLAAGMNPNAVNKEGKTPLLAAAEAGRLPVVELLLENGADVNARDKKFGATPLVWAAARNHAGVVKALLARGADPAAKGQKTGASALLSAALKGDRDITKMLLEKGANANDKDLEGRTALMFAAQNGHLTTVQLLLEKGADPRLKGGKNGVTALMLACARGNRGVVTLLLNSGAEINGVDNDGRTALMWAVRSGTPEIVNLLLDRGADVKVEEVEAMLLKAGAVPEKDPEPSRKPANRKKR